ncbi:MAG TPA: TorF family putative porin [Steroidobacteraceae bacterium]|nr:TorF family putative porin [Steroidobacteraceae bacterium]
MRATGITVIGFAALLAAGAAPAAGRWSGFIAATTDYVYRGVSQTHGHPALQGDLHYEAAGGTYLGTWVSNVHPADGTDSTLEFDLYLGHSWLLSDDWRARLTAVHYEYLDTPWQGPKDYDELVGSVTLRDRLTASVAWAPNTWRYSVADGPARRAATSYEMTGRQPVGRGWYLSGGAGYYDLSSFGEGGYWFWNAGLGFGRSHYQVDLSYFGLDAPDWAFLYNGAESADWALTVTWKF